VVIGNGIAVKQMDNGVTGTIILTDLGMTRNKAVKQQMRTAQGNYQKKS